jgi:DHA3 family macrolide efflux protein-like MFS transporter
MQLGWINAGYGIGFLAGGVLLGVWGGFKRRIYTSLIGVFGLGFGALLISQAPSDLFWLGLTGMIVMGLMNPIANGPIFALLQSIVAPEMQGRVFTVIISVSTAMGPIGLAFAGPLADRVSVQAWYLLGGGICLLICAAMLLSPALLKLDSTRSLQTGEAVPPGG